MEQPQNELDTQPNELSNESQVNERTLGPRRLSAPCRFKPVSKTQWSSRNLRQHRKYRHSYHSDRSSQRYRDSSDYKPSSGSASSDSSSPGSSTASDSAFSQSQSTLGSESGEQCFKDNCLHRRCNRENASFSGSESSQAERIHHRLTMIEQNEQDGQLSGQQKDGFEIIWYDLSYRVVDKRLTRLASYLRRTWPRLLRAPKETDEGDKGEHLVDEDQPPVASQFDEQMEQEGKACPPLKAPTTGKPRKVIFSSLNGRIKSGQLTAILGPSGAGKTTFLKCLTNSIVKGVSGKIDIRGSSAGRHLKLCTIPQKDYLFDNLTVMENLMFASRIKNTQAKFDHEANVQRVASLLGLKQCLKLKTNKLSGGQYKRVSIAQELLSKPDILILDEPTSGLDSLTCFRTVSVLRDLVKMSRAGLMAPLAIVMTIHQPQIKIFNLFHHVYILSSMGQCVYEGRPEDLVSTVADCCKLLPPPDDLNPASFIIDLASEVYGQEPIGQLSRLQRQNFHKQSQMESGISLDQRTSNLTNHLQPLFLAGDKFRQDSKDIETATNHLPRGTSQLEISERLVRRHDNHEHSFWLHTCLLVKRLWISMWRDPLLTTTRVTFHFVIPFVFYFIYSQKSGAANACPHVEREFDFQTMASEANLHRLEDQHNELILTFENVSLFFLLLYSFSMCVLAVTALSFPLNMQILLKETSNGWYSMPRFVMAKTLADLPMELTMPMISVAIAYVLTGQPSSYLSWRMLTVTAVMTLCSLISQTQGLLFGAYFMNNIQAAVFISQASSLPWIMLSGFTTRVSELPTLLQWLSFGSIYRLGIESIVAVRYGFGMCPCNEQLVNDTPLKMVGIPNQIRSLVQYYFDVYTDPSTNSTDSTASATSGGNDIFQKIASTLSRANTYGVDIASCHDVRPFILSAREVDEETLPKFLLILLLIFVCLKLLLFWIVRCRAG